MDLNLNGKRARHRLQRWTRRGCRGRRPRVSSSGAGTHSDDVLDALLPYVRRHLELASALRALPLGEVTNALVLVAGGRK